MDAVPIEFLEVRAFRIPTDAPESDGTLKWDATVLVLVTAGAGGRRGLGYSYADAATARLIHEVLRERVIGRDAMAVPECWAAMVHAIRNLGRPGIASMAISAVDNALWDLKARLIDVPLVRLLGPARAFIPVYGSGGFTSYSKERLRDQLGGWVAQGIARVKMKVGRDPEADPERVRIARQAIGHAALFVDSNGAYTRKQALHMAEVFVEQAVSWFEEPVSSDDLDGLRLLRDRMPPGLDVAAGEYGYDQRYFQRMLQAQAVDVLQADATRCCGVTGFMQVAALCEAYGLQLSAHCAPGIHAHPCCAALPVCHLEYFHDHVRIEHMLFDGALTPRGGCLHPAADRPGFGLELKQADAARFALS